MRSFRSTVRRMRSQLMRQLHLFADCRFGSFLDPIPVLETITADQRIDDCPMAVIDRHGSVWKRGHGSKS